MTITFEQAKEQGIVPWDDVYAEEQDYWIFRDRYPVTSGHLLFVPKVNDVVGITTCFWAAQRYGEWAVIKGDADGYNIGINSGQAAGQTIMYPHVHLIPRRSGDHPDPVGGVRGVIPNQANYRKSDYKNPIDK